jgi:hypothetical protein
VRWALQIVRAFHASWTSYSCILRSNFCVCDCIITIYNKRLEPGSKAYLPATKDNGVFGVLVLLLPSLHSGGQLHVRHLDQEKEYDFGSHSLYEANFVFLSVFKTIIYNLMIRDSLLFPVST